MGIYISEMEMPSKKNGAVIILYPNGTAVFEDGKEYQVVEVKPHGRLIDADALHIDLMDRGIEDIQMNDWYEIQQAVDDAPTIIEADSTQRNDSNALDALESEEEE